MEGGMDGEGRAVAGRAVRLSKVLEGVWFVTVHGQGLTCR
jgi:hypothetical protein